MFPRIKKIEPLKEFRLYIEFDEGDPVIYDVKEDIETIPDFQSLKTEIGLFQNYRVDKSRTCVYWSDRIDLPSDTLQEYGTRCQKIENRYLGDADVLKVADDIFDEYHGTFESLTK